jgi:hypothetical protein
LDGQNCPKCGSDQVVNGQCLKCGIVISKFLSAGQLSPEPVSYVAPSQAHKEYSYTISKDHIDYAERRIRDQRQRALVGVAIVVVIGAVVFLIWKLLSESASEYSGVYKNGNLIFGLFFPPSTGPKWYHGKPGNLEKFGMKDPQDVFYRGEPGEPDVVIAVYVKGGQYVGDRMGSELRDKLLSEAENSLLDRMQNEGVKCEIVDSRPYNVGARDGFMIEAEIEKNGKIYQMYVLNGYYQSRIYTVFFVGSDGFMTDDEQMKRVMDSFTFNVSVI